MLEYASPVWCLYSTSDISHLDSIQRRAAHWVYGSRRNPTNQTRTKSSDFCLQELRWAALQARINYFSVSFVHNILYERVSLSFKDHFSTSCPRSHYLTLTVSLFFFINSPFLWNSIKLKNLQLSNHIAFRSALHHFCHCLK